MRAMFGFGLLLSCASTPEGEWNGYRECPGDPPQSMQVRLEPVGGGWQGAGQMEWDDTNLGERFLLFNLEVSHPFLDRSLSNQPIDEGRFLPAQSVGPVNGLFLNGRIPPWIHQKDVIR